MFLYDEIHRKRCYQQHGVRLALGDLVIDIGANVGVFTTASAEAVGPSGAVICAEPLPSTFQDLQHNVALHRDWCIEAGTSCAPITCKNVGVGDGSASTATFTCYPLAGGWGTLSKYECPEGVQHDMAAFLSNSIADEGSSALPNTVQAFGRVLARASPAAFRAISRAAVQRMLSGARKIECQMVTVTDLLEEQSCRQVNLLKIDVERAEVDVLRGVLPQHWPLIAQVAVEVHQENLEHVLDILRGSAGYGSVVSEQSADLRGSSIWMVYAHRWRE